MRAVMRNRVMNNLYLTTFLITFASVAVGTILPCPAHSLDSDTHQNEDKELKNAKEINNNKDHVFVKK
ncbi:Coa2p NDAI_0F02320 [Naumovozyma dairenensis CBS 421]|uniref:Uncharacterized protein n=1 Tax=Naumovozyma dairenensis (strain ATCC 10597 / BCRC 20456 / CBS 421 / NBRC 0211 / NRRL Y-12639) TaxID=1071378 RepID=G0WCN9_NAUDC|nr:hypothetical protein NDAI_0F02320 [Naumovozyma dairenensis CBS 421]CCD25550.1 hypothetical protein NDAI_0F02320 [Naumovozyma dairenensis CBS 421]